VVTALRIQSPHSNARHFDAEKRGEQTHAE